MHRQDMATHEAVTIEIHALSICLNYSWCAMILLDTKDLSSAMAMLNVNEDGPAYCEWVFAVRWDGNLWPMQRLTSVAEINFCFKLAFMLSIIKFVLFKKKIKSRSKN